MDPQIINYEADTTDTSGISETEKIFVNCNSL